MARHNTNRGIEEGTFGAQDAVAQNTAEDCHEVNGCPVRSHSAGCRFFGYP